MDLNFFRRAEQRFAGRLDVALDYGLLVAMLRAHQLSTPAACAEAQGSALPQFDDPLAALVLGGEGWQSAIVAQKGCFNPAYARQRAVN